MLNYNPYFNNPQTQTPMAQMPNPYQNYQMPGYYPPAVPGYYPPAQPVETGWQKAGKVAIDLLKIGVAVAGGIAVYKLAENYFGDDEVVIATTSESSKSALYSGREEVFDD